MGPSNNPIYRPLYVRDHHNRPHRRVPHRCFSARKTALIPHMAGGSNLPRQEMIPPARFSCPRSSHNPPSKPTYSNRMCPPKIHTQTLAGPRELVLRPTGSAAQVLTYCGLHPMESTRLARRSIPRHVRNLLLLGKIDLISVGLVEQMSKM